MSRPYTERFNAVMKKLAASVGDAENAPRLLAGTGEDKVHLLVVMTAERGLCGGFNANIAKLAKAEAADLLAKGKTVKIITVGKKGRDAMKRDYGQYFVDHVDLTEVKRVGYADAQAVAANVLNRFDALSGDYRIPLDTPPPYDSLPVTAELSKGRDAAPGLAEEIAQAIKRDLGATARVTLVPHGTFPLTEGKTRRVQRTYT